MEDLGIDGRTEINLLQDQPLSLFLKEPKSTEPSSSEKIAKKFCDVYRSGNYIVLFTRVMRGLQFFNAGRGREIFSLLKKASRLALGPN